MIKKKFVFAVFTYNHAKYILEHLESIKFIINNYGDGYEFKLVLGDDGSKDNTVQLVRFWLSLNEKLFSEVIIQADGKNRGTCANYTNLWKHIDSDLFKVTAGDDVYSNFNILAVAEKLKQRDFVSGIPLILEEGRLKRSRSLIFHLMAADIIYRSQSLLHRMKRICVVNTPSLFYHLKFLKDQDLYEFIRKFRVTEDFPMMVRIAETYPIVKFEQTTDVYIYYRRTSGSTYIIRGSDFANDKVDVFNHLSDLMDSVFDKILVKNRLFCFLNGSLLVRRLLNISYYIYVLKVLKSFIPIAKNYVAVDIDEQSHILHYEFIKGEAAKVRKAFT